MAIPDSTRDTIIEAMHRFDQDLRHTAYWQKWTEDTTYKYAIEYEQRSYPVKKILSLATGAQVDEFHGGEEANSYAEDRGFNVVELRGEGEKRSWIFQSNPKYYDLIGAMRNLKEMTWLVMQNKNRVHAGNSVFLWEAGENAGVVGVATVMTEPSQMAEREDGKPYAKDQSKFAGLQTRVILRVDRVLESRLARRELAKDGVLQTLGVITFPNATNFALTAEQTQRLEELLGMTTSVLKWEQVRPNSFDLRLKNVDVLDRHKLRTLYESFISSKWNSKREDWDLGINKYLREDFKTWVDVSEQPLKSEVYATLGNWISRKAFKDSPRGAAAGLLWDFLFLCRPPDRLSPTEGGKNHIIITERFDKWWAGQQKLQGSSQVLRPTRQGDDVADVRFAEICKSTFLPQTFFENLERVLTTKKQLILQGAPGTGKTFVGEKLAEWWAAKTIGCRRSSSTNRMAMKISYKVYDPRPILEPARLDLN
jgi:hypothetical protein